MKLFNRIFIPLFALVFMFTACQKDNIDGGGVITPPDTPEVVETNPLVSRTLPVEEGLDLGCFVITFPFSMVDSSGIEYPINDITDLEDLETNGTFIVDFVYPLDVSFPDGEVSSVSNVEELVELFAECLPDGGWEEGDFPAYLINYDNSCYTLQYPLDLTDTDGETVTVNNEAEFNGAIAEELYFFVFPITLIDEVGEEVVTENNDEIFTALFSCNEFDPGDSIIWDWETGFDYIGCYMIEFPLDVILEDGTTVTVNTHEELCELMLTGSLAGYAFPLTLINVEGEEVIVNNEEEFEEAMEECWTISIGGDGLSALFALLIGSSDLDEPGDACFTISFPVTLDYENQDDIVLNSIEEMIMLLENITDPFFEVVFPITVTLNEDGSEVVLENYEELSELVEECS